MSNETIALWPDGDWCYLSELEWIVREKNSDNYELIKPDNPLYNEILIYKDGIEMSIDTIVLWPDGDWCFYEDLSEYDWKSDDYEFIESDNPRYNQFIDS